MKQGPSIHPCPLLHIIEYLVTVFRRCSMLYVSSYRKHYRIWCIRKRQNSENMEIRHLILITDIVGSDGRRDVMVWSLTELVKYPLSVSMKGADDDGPLVGLTVPNCTERSCTESTELLLSHDGCRDNVIFLSGNAVLLFRTF